MKYDDLKEFAGSTEVYLLLDRHLILKNPNETYSQIDI